MDIGLQNRELMPEAVASELEALAMRIRSAWLKEHTEDDGHGHITAYDIVLTKDDTKGATGSVTGGGNATMSGAAASSFGGNVRANTNAANSGVVEIGGSLGTPSGNDGTIGTGIDINATEAATAPRIRLLSWIGTFRELRFGWTRGATLFDVPLMIRDDSILGGYAVMPGKGTTPVKNCFLGSNTDGFSAGYWTGAYVKQYFRPEYSSAQGEWTDVAYNAANYTATGGTWTPPNSGAQVTYTYSLVGKQLTVSWVIAGTAVSAGVTALNLAIPNGYVAAKDMRGCHFAQDNGAAQVSAMCRVVGGGTTIIIYATAGAGGWANTGGANTSSTSGTFTFAIQ